MTITADEARKLALQPAEKEVAKVYTYIKEAAAKGHGGIRLGVLFGLAETVILPKYYGL